MPTGDLPEIDEAPEETETGAVAAVTSYIRGGIREGWLVPGQRLVEPDLIGRLQVSRGTVREALMRLQGEGLVEFERYRGARIRILTRKTVIELNQIRASLEGLGARLAATVITEEGAELLRATHVPLKEALHDYAAYNKAFHGVVLRLSGNESLIQMLSAASREAVRLQFEKTLLTRERMQKSHVEHGAIVDAILKRDSVKAGQKMIAHINASAEAVMQAPEHFFAK